MAKIKLAKGGFTLIPEGVTTFKVVEVEYDEDFGKMRVHLQTKSGQKHTEQFMLLKNDGEVNEGALKAFSYFAKTCLNNYELDEIDEQDIVGCYITATVTHREYESNKEPGKMLKSAQLNDYTVAVGFANESISNDDELDDLDDDPLDDLDEFLDD